MSIQYPFKKRPVRYNNNYSEFSSTFGVTNARFKIFASYGHPVNFSGLNAKFEYVHSRRASIPLLSNLTCKQRVLRNRWMALRWLPVLKLKRWRGVLNVVANDRWRPLPSQRVWRWARSREGILGLAWKPHCRREDSSAACINFSAIILNIHYHLDGKMSVKRFTAGKKAESKTSFSSSLFHAQTCIPNSLAIVMKTVLKYFFFFLNEFTDIIW